MKQKNLTGRRLINRVAQSCRVSESIVGEILRAAGAVAADHIAQHRAVKVPGFGTFHRSGIHDGVAIKTVSFFPNSGSPSSAAAIIVSPCFRPTAAFVAATRSTLNNCNDEIRDEVSE